MRKEAVCKRNISSEWRTLPSPRPPGPGVFGSSNTQFISGPASSRMLLTCLSSDLGVGLKNENTAQLQCSQSTFSRKVTFWRDFHGEKDRPSISIHQASVSIPATFSLAPCRRVYVPSMISHVILFLKLPGHCLTAWDSGSNAPGHSYSASKRTNSVLEKIQLQALRREQPILLTYTF